MSRALLPVLCLQVIVICVLLPGCGGGGAAQNAVQSPPSQPSQPASGTIPATFFGMNQVHLTGPAGSGCQSGNERVPFTNAPIGAFRDWDMCRTQWPDLNPSLGNYNWLGLDTVLASALAANVNDVLMEVGRIPNWISSNPGDTLCDDANINNELPGLCDPPTDLNPDGTGTDATFRTFAAALLTHISDPSYLSTHAQVKYIEIFEEFHRSDTVGGVKTLAGTVNVNGTAVTWASGDQFSTVLPNDIIVIGSDSYTIAAVTDATDLVLSTTAGNQSGVSFTISGCHNPANGIPCSWRGTFAQMLRMLQDLRCLAKGNTNDPITATNQTCGSAGYPQIGIYPSLQVSVGNAGPDENYDNGAKVMANFLYCNQSPPPGSNCNYGSAGSAATDMIGGHAYFDTNLPEAVINWVVSQVGLFSSADKAKPYFIGEGGWGPNSNVTDPGLQAAYVARWYLGFWISGVVQRAYWWSWEQAGPDGKGGLWSPQYIDSGSLCHVPDPVGGYYCTGGTAYKEMVDWLSGITLTGYTCPGGCSDPSNGVFEFEFTRSNGYQAVVMWDSSPTSSCSNAQCGSTPVPTVAFSASQWRDLAGNTHPGAPTSIGASPIILENMTPP